MELLETENVSMTKSKLGTTFKFGVIQFNKSNVYAIQLTTRNFFGGS